MALQFVSVEDDDQIESLSKLAECIWHEYWPDKMPASANGKPARFLTCDALKEQIASGFQYYMIDDGENAAGFIGIRPKGQNAQGKLYIAKNSRGKGYSGQAFEFLQGHCKESGYDSIWLEVDEHDRPMVDVYKVKPLETERYEKKAADASAQIDPFIMEEMDA